MHRNLNILLALGILQYVIVWYAGINQWFLYEKEVYLFSSVIVVVTYILKYFSNPRYDRKYAFVLILIIMYLAVTSLAKYKIEVFPIIKLLFLITLLILLSFELYDWLTAKPKEQKMNLVQLVCLLSFLFFLIFKIGSFAGAVIPMIFFHLSLIGISIDLLINKR